MEAYLPMQLSNTERGKAFQILCGAALKRRWVAILISRLLLQSEEASRMRLIW